MKRKEYAVYKGEKLLAMGTSKECAAEMNVSKEYIEWMVTPTGRRRLAARKNPSNCTQTIRLDEDE